MIDFSEKMVAPCGMNCSYCYAHHKRKNPCLGCRNINQSKPKSCRNCKIKECVESKNYQYCFECPDYPCVLIKRLDKSYQTRYNESLITNFHVIEEKGMHHYLSYEKKRFQCPDCSSTLNMHDKKCYECGKESDIGKVE